MAEAVTLTSPIGADGRILLVDGRRYQLFGVAAPRPQQRCTDGAGRWRRGDTGMIALSRLAAFRAVDCTVAAERTPDTRATICFVADTEGVPVDIGGYVVRKGYAVADPFESGRYLADMALAKQSATGLWRGHFAWPWEWGGGRQR